jgi:hypothetical protein
MKDSWDCGQLPVSLVRRRARAYLLVNVELSENLGRVKEVLVLEDPVSCQHTRLVNRVYGTDFFAFQASRGRLRIKAIQYPLTRNRMVMKAWTAASGTM